MMPNFPIVSCLNGNISVFSVRLSSPRGHFITLLRLGTGDVYYTAGILFESECCSWLTTCYVFATFGSRAFDILKASTELQYFIWNWSHRGTWEGGVASA